MGFGETGVGTADEASVIVVGLGVLGSALAHRLAKNGWRTVFVDQYSFGHSRAASGTNSRIIRYSHGDEEADTRSAWEARTLWREIEEEAGLDLMMKTGMACSQARMTNGRPTARPSSPSRRSPSR
jgi:glycine/D-amino acid oxidase-like deaminating enzyme